MSLGAESHLPQGEEHRVDNAHELTLSLADAGGLRAAAVGTTAGGLFAVLAVVAVARFWGGGGGGGGRKATRGRPAVRAIARSDLISE